MGDEGPYGGDGDPAVYREYMRVAICFLSTRCVAKLELHPASTPCGCALRGAPEAQCSRDSGASWDEQEIPGASCTRSFERDAI